MAIPDARSWFVSWVHASACWITNAAVPTLTSPTNAVFRSLVAFVVSCCAFCNSLRAAASAFLCALATSRAAAFCVLSISLVTARCACSASFAAARCAFSNSFVAARVSLIVCTGVLSLSALFNASTDLAASAELVPICATACATLVAPCSTKSILYCSDITATFSVSG